MDEGLKIKIQLKSMAPIQQTT